MRTLNSLSMQALYGSDKGNGLSAWQFWPWRMWRDRRRRATPYGGRKWFGIASVLKSLGDPSFKAGCLIGKPKKC
ncbi:MAG: hypothetical protein Q8N48_07125 [Thiobacillus sp.]|nr:hypothetical protein [Thiobacillus sp.]MDP2978583.1 hypothetical protein [Thiobacillus sp.]